MDRIKAYVVSYFVGNAYNNIQVIRHWIENLQRHYLVDCNRTFVVITDNIFAKIFQKLNNDVYVLYIDPKTTTNININKRAKFKYILDWLAETSINDGYIAFIQSNASCKTDVKLVDMIDIDDDITLNLSCWFMKKTNAKQKSKLIGYDKNNYIQAGHFIGKTKCIKNMAEWIHEKMESDAQLGFFPKWHDEYYVNMYYHNIKTIRCFSGVKFTNAQNSGSINFLDKKKWFSFFKDPKQFFLPKIEQINALKRKDCKCLIIGSNPSILDFKLKQIINDFDGIVIRCNRDPDKELIDNYGDRTDLFVTYEGCNSIHNKNVEKLIFSKSNTYEFDHIFQFLENRQYFTTGFKCIIMSLCMGFKTFIFGFGNSSDIDDSKSFRVIYDNELKKQVHDISIEHQFINMLEKQKKISRLETMFSENMHEENSSYTQSL